MGAMVHRCFRPLNDHWHLLLACVFARYQFVQGLGYPYELGDELAIVSHEPKKTLDLGDSGEGSHYLIASILPSLVAIPWTETMGPRYVICLWNSSHFEG